MSSLTSLGVNKNTTRFAPKPRRSRRPRKAKITPPLTDSEDDTKYPIIINNNPFHYSQPGKAQCAYARDPPTPPFLSKPTTNNSDNNKKIPTIVAEDEGSLPASPPEDEYRFEPVILEEEMTLDEVTQLAKEDLRKAREKRKTKSRFKKRRKPTLQTLDEIDYDPSTTVNPESSMADHTRDTIYGVVSHDFKQVELTRRQKISKERENKKKDGIMKMDNPYRKADSPIYRRDVDTLTESTNAPQVRLVDGEIVLDVESLVRRPVQVDHERQQQEGELEVVEENEYSRRINNSTYSTRGHSTRWSELETADFYNALSQFGTDFEMISTVMPGRTRQHIRNKYNKEDKINPQKISEYLIRKRKLPDLQKYSAIIGKDLEEVPDEFMEDE